MFNNPTNGEITLAGSTAYMFEGQITISAATSGNNTVATSFGGTATVESIGYTVISSRENTLIDKNDHRTSYVTTRNSTVVTRDKTETYATLIIQGIVRINGSGTFIPQFKFDVINDSAPTILTNSYFKIHPIGTNNVTSVGNWD